IQASCGRPTNGRSGAENRGSSHDDMARHSLHANSGVAADGVEHSLGGAATENLEVHVEAAQLWAGTGGQYLPVVEAHHRDLTGHVHSSVPKHVHDAAGNLVTPAEDRVDIRGLIPQRVGCSAAPRLAPAAEPDLSSCQLETRICQGGQGTPCPVARCREAHIAGDVSDALAPGG